MSYFAPVLYPPRDLVLIQPGRDFVIGSVFSEKRGAEAVRRQLERFAAVQRLPVEAFIFETDRNGLIRKMPEDRTMNPNGHEVVYAVAFPKNATRKGSRVRVERLWKIRAYTVRSRKGGPAVIFRPKGDFRKGSMETRKVGAYRIQVGQLTKRGLRNSGPGVSFAALKARIQRGKRK